MAILDFIKGELLEIIEWTDDSRDTLAWRFPDEDKAIKRGAQLIVRESQVSQFVYLGEFGDTFGPGKWKLVTDNIPILTRLKSWKYGFEITAFVVENISVPPEVEKAIDKKSSMAVIGDLNEYVKLQMAEGMAQGGGGAGGMATEMAVGLAIAQQMMRQQGGSLFSGALQPGATQATVPDLLAPTEVAQLLGVSEEDVMSVIASGQLAAKQIGSSYRIKRSAVEAFLAD